MKKIAEDEQDPNRKEVSSIELDELARRLWFPNRTKFETWELTLRPPEGSKGQGRNWRRAQV